MSLREPDLERVAESIGSWFDAVYFDLDRLARTNDRNLLDSRGRRGQLSDKSLRALRPAAVDFLGLHSVPEAAGVIIGPGALGFELGVVDWWSRKSNGDIYRVAFALDPDAAGYYDIVSFPWFSEVLATGRPTIQGPYLDYAGMDQYILTLMVPFALDGDVVGTAGCDIEVRSLESVIIPLLRAIKGDAALVARNGRIIAGNSGRFLVGNRFGDLPDDGVRVTVPGIAPGLAVVAVPSRY